MASNNSRKKNLTLRKAVFVFDDGMIEFNATDKPGQWRYRILAKSGSRLGSSFTTGRQMVNPTTAKRLFENALMRNGL